MRFFDFLPLFKILFDPDGGREGGDLTYETASKISFRERQRKKKFNFFIFSLPLSIDSSPTLSLNFRKRTYYTTPTWFKIYLFLKKVYIFAPYLFIPPIVSKLPQENNENSS
jgi:hypothetical protein